MPAKVDFGELQFAFDFASMGAEFGNEAFVSVKTGKCFFKGGDLDDEQEIPEDLETSNEYLRVPDKNELDLGRALVFAFVEENLADEWDVVRELFRRRGVSARFKDLLDSHGMLDPWYKYEEARTIEALREWCEENGLQVADNGKKPV